ncbi:MAG: hypothetical protein KIT27_09815 [Legionellales bacterium]|nr:hypothetical protein [Legionellales bacterium]
MTMSKRVSFLLVSRRIPYLNDMLVFVADNTTMMAFIIQDNIQVLLA